MSDDEKRRLRDEVAELSKAVRDLREQLAGQGAHHCHGCHCAQPVWVWPYIQPTYPAITYPYVVTCGSTTTTPDVTITNADIFTSSVTATIPGAITYS